MALGVVVMTDFSFWRYTRAPKPRTMRCLAALKTKRWARGLGGEKKFTFFAQHKCRLIPIGWEPPKHGNEAIGATFEGHS